MENNKPNNPPAFPLEYTQISQGCEYKESHPGMTLRDYFAAKAMQGMINTGSFKVKYSEENFKTESQISYEIADAMLKAREKANDNRRI